MRALPIKRWLSSRQFWRRTPDSPEANLGAGLAVYATGDKAKFQEAANYLQQFVEVAPDTNPMKDDAKAILTELKNTRERHSREDQPDHAASAHKPYNSRDDADNADRSTCVHRVSSVATAFVRFPTIFAGNPTLTLSVFKLYYDCTTMLAPSLYEQDRSCLAPHSAPPIHPETGDIPTPESFSAQMSAKLGEILVRENLISPQHLREALDYQREHGGRLGFNLVKLGLVSDDMITAVLSRQYGIPSVNLDLFNIDPSVLSLIPQEVAQKHSVLPLSRVGATLTLAMVDPTNVFAMDDVKFMTGLNVEPVVVAEGSVQQAIAKYYGSSREIELASTPIEEVAQELGSKSNGNGGITHDDLVSLDSIDFDHEPD